VGTNRGGYATFTVDIADYVSFGDEVNYMLVYVYDPTDSQDIVNPVGKQTLRT
jgi:hypothetical protein